MDLDFSSSVFVANKKFTFNGVNFFPGIEFDPVENNAAPLRVKQLYSQRYLRLKLSRDLENKLKELKENKEVKDKEIRNRAMAVLGIKEKKERYHDEKAKEVEQLIKIQIENGQGYDINEFNKLPKTARKRLDKLKLALNAKVQK